jgi:PAS domain S-box-containing protein
MIVLIDLEGKIIDCNDIAAKIIGASKKRLVNKPFNELDIFNNDEISRLLSIYPKAKKLNDIGPIDFELRMNKEQNWVEVYPAPIMINKKLIGIQLIFKNITERKRAEKEMMMHMLKFQLGDGRSYLVKETQPTVALEGYKEMLKLNYHGIIISRIPKNDFKVLLKSDNYEFHWLAEKGGEDSIPPKVNEIFKQIEFIFKKHQRSTVLLFTGLDYLISRTGFKKTALLVQWIKEIVYLTGNISFLTIDPLILNNRELKLLELECDQLQLRLNEKKLTDPQIRMLRSIYMNNLTGIKPSYTDLGQALGLSKPTVRKRVRRLTNAGFMSESVRGRNKVLELTKVGRELIN